jgi:hypothetical protein
MNAALPARTALRWRRLLTRALVIAAAIISVYLSILQIHIIITQPEHTGDWWLFQNARLRLDGHSMYVWGATDEWGDTYTYRYAPLFAYLMQPFVRLGFGIWRLMHIAAVLLLPWRLAIGMLLLYPFWFDVFHGNVMTFVAISGWLALAGSRWGTVAFFLLFLLVPRPLQLPLIAWVMWKRPEWRWPAIGIVIVYAILTLLTGEALTFIEALTRSGDNLGNPLNIGPSRWIGAWWAPVGFLLAGWLTWRGRLGLAGAAAMPYFLPFHALIVLLEFGDDGTPGRPSRADRSPRD